MDQSVGHYLLFQALRQEGKRKSCRATKFPLKVLCPKITSTNYLAPSSKKLIWTMVGHKIKNMPSLVKIGLPICHSEGHFRLHISNLNKKLLPLSYWSLLGSQTTRVPSFFCGTPPHAGHEEAQQGRDPGSEGTAPSLSRGFLAYRKGTSSAQVWLRNCHVLDPTIRRTALPRTRCLMLRPAFLRSFFLCCLSSNLLLLYLCIEPICRENSKLLPVLWTLEFDTGLALLWGQKM